MQLTFISYNALANNRPDVYISDSLNSVSDLASRVGEIDEDHVSIKDLFQICLS